MYADSPSLTTTTNIFHGTLDLSERTLPFDSALIANIRERFPTPFYIYDEAAIRKCARDLIAAFSLSLIHISEPTRPY